MTPNVTTALRPMPDASANGRFAKRPMQMHMSAAPSAVAVAAPSNGTPAARQDAGIHEDDVRHRQERRETGEQLGAQVAPALRELEESFHRAPFHGSGLIRTGRPRPRAPTGARGSGRDRENPWSRASSSAAAIGGRRSRPVSASGRRPDRPPRRASSIGRVGDRAAGDARRERDVDDVAPARLGVERVVDEDRSADLDLEPGLLAHLALERLAQGLPRFDAAARQQVVDGVARGDAGRGRRGPPRRGGARRPARGEGHAPVLPKPPSPRTVSSSSSTSTGRTRSTRWIDELGDLVAPAKLDRARMGSRLTAITLISPR